MMPLEKSVRKHSPPLRMQGVSELFHYRKADRIPQDVIFGNLDLNLLQIDTPLGVYSREIIREGSRCPGGFVLAPRCGIPATAPPVNVYALTRAAHDFILT